MRARKIVTFYNKKQVCFDNIRKSSYSKSPLKPYLLLKKIKDDGYSDMLNVVSDFKPFTKNDFYTAHTKHYVNNVFNKRGNYNSNSVPWSHNLVESLTYTNASLYNAIKYAVIHYLGQQKIIEILNIYEIDEDKEAIVISENFGVNLNVINIDSCQFVYRGRLGSDELVLNYYNNSVADTNLIFVKTSDVE